MIKFYKYPECAPKENGWYLCIIEDEDKVEPFRYENVCFSDNWGFGNKHLDKLVVSFTSTKARDAHKSSQI